MKLSSLLISLTLLTAVHWSIAVVIVRPLGLTLAVALDNVFDEVPTVKPSKNYQVLLGPGHG